MTNILWKFCGVNTAKFLNYFWPFFNIMYERVKNYLSRIIMIKYMGKTVSGIF